MSYIDFDKNNYEARRILLNDILIKNKDNIVLEQQKTSIYSRVIRYKFTLKADKYLIEGYLDCIDNDVKYLKVEIYRIVWLGLIYDYCGYCVFNWEALIKYPEDIEQSKSYLRCILNNKVSSTAQKAEKGRKKESEEEYKLTKAFVNYFRRSCSTSD